MLEKRLIYCLIILLFHFFSLNAMIPGYPPNTCPAPITAGFLHLNCCDIYYELSGVPINGTIVFLAPFLGNHFSWPCQRNFFCAQGYQVLLIDRRGNGFTSSTPPFTTAQSVSDIDSVVTTLGINNFILVGWSLGGAEAQLYAATFQNKVSKLILIDTSPKFVNDATWSFGATTQEAETLLLAAELAKTTNNIAPFIPAAAQLAGVEDCIAISPATMAGAGILVTQTISVDDPQAQLNIILNIGTIDLRSQLQFITAPTLILYGCNDALTLPGASIYMAAHIAGSIIVGLQGKTHLMPVTATDRCNQLILEFLQGIPIISDTACSIPVACSDCAAV